MQKLFTRVSLSLLLISGLVVGSIPIVNAQTVVDDEEVMIQIQEAVDNGPHFRFEDNVRITEDLVGDVYTAGGQVIVDGNIDGDLLVAGGNVTINGDVTEDVRVAGGTVTINGTIGQDVSAGGGQVYFGSDSEVLGSVVVGAGMVNMSGLVMGQTYVGAGEVILSGTFENTVTGGVDQLTVDDTAVIAGDINMEVVEDPAIAEVASISGAQNIDRVERKDAQKYQANPAENALGQFFWGALSMFVGGAVLLALMSRMMVAANEAVTDSWLAVLGWGLVKLIITPVLAVLIMVTVIGIPIGIVLLLLYIVALMIAGWVSAYIVGRKIAGYGTQEFLDNKYVQLLIGAVVIALLSRLPFVGGIVQLLTLLTGLGAILRVEKSFLFDKRSKSTK